MPSDEHYFDNFKTVVAAAPRDGYTPYWLGRGFTAGGMTFKGPFTADFAQEVDGGVSTDYVGGSGSMNLTSYSPAAWAKLSPRFKTLPAHAVQAAEHAATYAVVSAGDRPINTAWVTVQFGDTTVVATAGSLGAATPGGPDANPLIDEQTFLSVLQHLRPYPK